MRFIGGDQGDQLTRQVRAVASGALPSGEPVVVNSDGTVEVVEETSVSQSVGSPTIFESADSRYISATFDSSNNKVVIAYNDDGNNNYGTAIVGTVSGTTISFGTPVVFESAETNWTSSTFDSSNNKVVIAYQDRGNSNNGTAIVGTVSDTSISFGSAAVFGGDSEYISLAYDSNSQKIVLAYKDNGNSNQGTANVGTVSGNSISFSGEVVYETGSTIFSSAIYDSSNDRTVIGYRDFNNSNYGTAVVGTISSGDITFGTPVVFNSGSVNFVSGAFDSDNGKAVFAYQDNGNSGYGTAIVGTVSGTSISFGSEAVFESASTEEISASYDSYAGKITIFYSDAGNSQFGTVVAGTVSDTSISFGSPVVFENARIDYTASAFDSSNNKVVCAYRDRGGSFVGNSVVFQNAATVPNLTPENFIGFAQSGFPDTGNAVIDSKGAINDKQSGLTPGQAYYVQTDGTLSTTADDPSVFAGTAVAANKIIVEG